MTLKNFYTILLLLLCTLQFAQGPWTQGKNKGYFQAGFSGIFYDRIRIDEKNASLSSSISDITSQLYSEYGITNTLDVSLNIPYKNTTATPKDGSKINSITGFSNITIGFKYKIHDQKWKVATGLFYSTNTIKSNDMIALRTGYDATTILPYLAVGTSNNKLYYFINLGYGYMSNNYTDYVKIDSEIGYKFLRKTHIILNLDLKKAVNEEKYFESVSNAIYKSTAIYSDKQEFYSIGLKLNHEFITNKLGLNIGAIGAFYVNNLPVAPAIHSGIYYKI